MSLDESQSHEGLELVGERPNNISSLLPITKSLSQHKLDIKENEMIEAGHTKPPTVPVPIKHDGDNNTFPNAAKVRPDSGDIVFFNRYILIRLLLALLTPFMMLLCVLYALAKLQLCKFQSFSAQTEKSKRFGNIHVIIIFLMAQRQAVGRPKVSNQIQIYYFKTERMTPNGVISKKVHKISSNVAYSYAQHCAYYFVSFIVKSSCSFKTLSDFKTVKG
eukprot:549941_1